MGQANGQVEKPCPAGQSFRNLNNPVLETHPQAGYNGLDIPCRAQGGLGVNG